ncbi:MAG: SH3 domain-containing protein [Scytolyngbya sp. HA4215-MV1]|jgi:hypothetical protein|nr:SH3 domain-containing protein [Scytolyngbya sp. HA4215-MV1]
MNSNKSSWFVLAGVAAVGGAAGMTYALMQPTPDASPIASTSPTPTESASISTSTSPSASPAIKTAPMQAGKPAASAANSASSPTSNSAANPVNNPDIAPAPSASAQRIRVACETRMAIIADPNPPLNVRSTPDAENSKVVGTLPNNTFVTVVNQNTGWFQISDPIQGWIAKNRTESSCNQKVEKIQFGKGSNSAVIRDRFIGTGSHEYILQAQQGQTMTLYVSEGPFPSVWTPDGKVFATDLGDKGRTNWSDQLPVDGNYKLVLESNFKGYDYSFEVEIR